MKRARAAALALALGVAAAGAARAQAEPAVAEAEAALDAFHAALAAGDRERGDRRRRGPLRELGSHDFFSPSLTSRA